jgi:hypothetical protein
MVQPWYVYKDISNFQENEENQICYNFVRMMFGEAHITSGVPTVNQIQLTLTIGYLLMTCYFFSNWLIFSLRHPGSTPEDKLLSFVMFLVTTIFWPLMIPMSCLEMVQKKQIDFNKMIPVLLAIFVLSISYYLTE